MADETQTDPIRKITERRVTRLIQTKHAIALEVVCACI